ncbi:hypothetical protein pb186bvf_011351 [Paramecium bursaria]
MDECTFCESIDFRLVIRKALYSKYSSSQNYIYSRIINDLIYARKSRVTSIFKDYLFYDYEDEYLTKYYDAQQLVKQLEQYRVKLLSKDQVSQFQTIYPRIYHEPAATTLQNYEYYHRSLRFHRRQRNRINSMSQSDILNGISGLQQIPPASSAQQSIFYIQNQLKENNKKTLGLQLRALYQQFTERRLRTKRPRHQSVDKETQTLSIPIIKQRDKQFLQQIIKQQKLACQPYENKLKYKKYEPQRGSSGQKLSSTTARIYSSQMTSARVSSGFKQSRTKSQSYDSVTKAIENKLKRS